MKILDYVTKEELQGMQEKYARACNVSVMVEDIAGKAVTKGAGRAEEGKTKFNENRIHDTLNQSAPAIFIIILFLVV